MRMMSRSVDAIVVGSGHNGLVAAAYLARAGWEVAVIERSGTAGGTVRTEELTEPGFRHDTFSCWHPLFHLSGAFAELGGELAARGLEYCDTPGPTTATVSAAGEVLLAERDPVRSLEGICAADRAAYDAELAGFGEEIPVLGELLGTELHSLAAGRLALKLRRLLGGQRSIELAGGLLSSAQAWFASRFEGDEVGRLYAPWALHTGLSPSDAGAGFQTLAIAATLHGFGLPVVKGGSQNFVTAFERLIADHGGVVRTGVEVERILVRGGRAVGVVAGEEEIGARRAVIAGVTPTQLYGRLLAAGDAPAEVIREGRRYRYGRRSGMQVHVALAEPLRWRDSRLDETPIVHLADRPEDVALACAQAAAGFLPASPTVVVGQPARVDPTRVPEGRGMIWIQLQEVPRRPRGDVAGEIEVGDGEWTDELVAAYVERVLAKLEPQVTNLASARGAIKALSPVEIERRNPNLVGGDIYAGDCELGQSYLWRPLPGHGSHKTPVDGLHMCGAATFPGPGLNAASGRIVARGLLKEGVGRRLAARLPGRSG
jgi:phytoene dehydrogenase-like protein